jgi:murein DD-endopeptidase MepM/ murein hydrolase activator NlpD
VRRTALGLVAVAFSLAAVVGAGCASVGPSVEETPSQSIIRELAGAPPPAPDEELEREAPPSVSRPRGAGEVPPPLVACGALDWPVDAPVTSPFGWRVDPRGFHAGIDLSARSGTPVRAACDGTVVFAGRRGRYGRLVIVRHDDGALTYYAHNEELLVRAGARVARGAVIARSGRSGRVSGPHVHFELRLGGLGPVDPVEYLPSGRAARSLVAEGGRPSP